MPLPSFFPTAQQKEKWRACLPYLHHRMLSREIEAFTKRKGSVPSTQLRHKHCWCQKRQPLLKAEVMMFLAGLLLSYLLQLASAQGLPRISVVTQPPFPKEFQDVTLDLQGVPRDFESCQWSRDTRSGKSGPILTYFSGNNPPVKIEEAYTERESVQQNCSLVIRRLLTQDAGTYLVTLRTKSTQQQGDTDQKHENAYEASVSLQVSGSNKITLQVQLIPRDPVLGQEVTLVPQRVPEEFYFCEWSKQNDQLKSKVIKTYTSGEGQKSVQQEREVIHQNCSLHISQLRTSDKGSYSLYIEAPLKQQQLQPGRESTQQGYEGKQFYTGLVKLEVAEQQTNHPHSGSSSVSYSTGIVAVALAGSLAWADPLMTVFNMFLCFLASLRPRRLL